MKIKDSFPVKKLISPIMLVTASAGTLFFGILWINNLVSAWRYHVMLMEGDTFAGDFPPGLWPSLSWSTVDASTVTTLIPFFGFLLILHGIFKVENREEWPFFSGYERLNIALGLLGTIWGIILVGYYPEDQINVTALIRCCLHTAMFSTLIAVFWVMVVLPAAVMPLMHAYRKLRGGLETGIDSLGELADEFTRHVGGASEALRSGAEDLRRFRTETREGAESLASLRTELSACGAEFESRRKSETLWLEKAAEAAHEFTEAGRLVAELQRNLAETNRELAERNGILREEKSRLEEERRELAESKRKLIEHNTALQDENQRLNQQEQSLNQQLDEARNTVSELRSTLEEIRKALQR